MGSIFGGRPSAPTLPPPPPPPPPPAPLPDENSPLAKAERKKKAASAVSRSGRMSTILSDGTSDRLGG